MRKKPFLIVRHKSRMRYGKAHLDKPEAFWKKILWSDETKIELFGQNKRRYAWRKNTLNSMRRTYCPPVKFGGGSIMLWGCVASTCTGNLVKVEGHMNSSQYQQILDKNVQELVTKLKLCRFVFFSRTMILSTVQNPPRNSCRSTSTMFWNGHPSPQTLTSLKMYGLI